MPTEEDDNDHDAIVTTTIPPTTVTPPPGFQSPGDVPATTPTDHPDRPINAKPTTTPTTVPPTTGEEETSPTATESASSWLPGFLPTLGVSPRTQAWIYASLALILVFCAGLGVYLYTARRRRLRNSPRDNYEFELLDEEEAEGLTAEGRAAAAAEKGGVAGAGVGGGKKKRTRGGELYDAFAGGSDEDEDDEFYHDNAEGSSAGSGSEGARREKRALGVDDDEEQHVLGSDSEDEGDEREGLRSGRR